MIGKIVERSGENQPIPIPKVHSTGFPKPAAAIRPKRTESTVSPPVSSSLVQSLQHLISPQNLAFLKERKLKLAENDEKNNVGKSKDIVLPKKKSLSESLKDLHENETSLKPVKSISATRFDLDGRLVIQEFQEWRNELYHELFVAEKKRIAVTSVDSAQHGLHLIRQLEEPSRSELLSQLIDCFLDRSSASTRFVVGAWEDSAVDGEQETSHLVDQLPGYSLHTMLEVCPVSS